MADTKKYSDKYKQDIINEICTRVINGEKLSFVVKDENYPCRATIDNWCNEDKELLGKYAHAREAHAFNIGVFQIDQVVDEIRNGKLDPAQSRVILDALKWQASKFYPKMFGDKIQQEHSGEIKTEGYTPELQEKHKKLKDQLRQEIEEEIEEEIRNEKKKK